jgi:hypothetical protein
MQLLNLDDEKKFLHDLSTPLSVVLFQLEAAARALPPGEASQRLAKVQEQIKIVVELVRSRRDKFI